LEKARKKYEGLKSLQADFQLTIELAERKAEVQKGTMYQQGEKYRVKLPSQDVISDGKATYVYLKKNNEVQINDASNSNDANSLSPKALLKLYQQGNFKYFISGNAKEGGKAVTQVEVVPNDRNVEYSKLRVSIDKDGQIVSLKSFNKDGSRYTLVLSSLKSNKGIKDDIFVFDQSKYPGVHVEDLRTN
jgi:outer membrane lipoprotein-sorting protein